MIDILAIGAHPDDVELAASGTLLVHKNLGYTIGIVDLTRGELGTRGSADQRDLEAQKSSEILGLTFRTNLALKDGFFEQDEASLLKLIAVIRHLKPRVVLATAVSDRHPDHGRGASFSSRACFLAGLQKIKTEYEGVEQQAHRPGNVYHFIQDHYISPDFVIDISAVYEKKMESIMAFESQFFNSVVSGPQTPISGKSFLYFLEARARDFGRLIHSEFAEGFTTEKPLGISDLTYLK